MTKLERIEDLYATLHKRFGKIVGRHASKLSDEERTKVCVTLIDNALQDFNKMQELLWTYDWLANPDMADESGSVYRYHHLYKKLTADKCAEMQLYTEVSRVAWDMDMTHAIKMPPFLRHLGKVLDIDNDTLCDFIFEDGHYHFSMRLVACMAMCVLNKNRGVNGVYQDYLSYQIDHYKNEIKNAKTDDEQSDLIGEFMNKLFDMHNHEQIGRMLGLRGWQLGNYDALAGWFQVGFNPRIVKMAKELNEYVKPIMKGEMLDILPETEKDFMNMLYDKMMQLAEKHHVAIYEEQLTFDYIFFNNCHLFEIVFEPED